MTIPPVLLEILVCPTCRQALVERPVERQLQCLACRVAYPVRDGIPILIADDAVPLDA